MNIKNFVSIFMLLLFAVALVQCSKENAATEENVGVEMRNTSQDCVVDIGPQAQTKTERVDNIFLPGIDCPFTGLVVYKQYFNRFAFTDFILVIPDDPDCDDLKDHLDGLPEQQRLEVMEAITELAYDEAKRRILQEYADENPEVPEIKNVLTYRALCTELCIEYDPDCLIDEKMELEEPREIGARGDKSCWIWKYISCGDGCCKTTADYVRDRDGKIVLYSASTESYGPCENGPPQDWPSFKKGCWFGSIVGDCEIRCYPY